MYRSLSLSEETVLKRSFSNWRIFKIYNTLSIIIRSTPIDPVNTYKVNNAHLIKYNTNIKIKNKNKIEQRNSKSVSNYLENNSVFVYSHSIQKDLISSLKPILLGLQIGVLLKKKFVPNLNFAELVTKYNKDLDYPHVIVQDDVANLVIYGRDIMGNSIVSHHNEIKENQIIIILNKKLEAIGIGRSRFYGKAITQSNKITIDNLQDIGTYYLQHENKYDL